ncbi:hypothetical protein QTL95_24765 [Rhizobium sp. S152]|uniref:hypothetical protein n=1 Tax=Rhizobium sp. S152 TaxID=3055038 RepID=UPI0025A98318|nr:hypothetical protein [Rhizobium sp. S152]MDM9629106.1 hypothetical protein [Rhizobium sp. S152]
MPLSVEQLAGDPQFLATVRFHAVRMRGLFDAGPRLARLLASHQRWLLAQTAYALSMERDLAIPASGLTAVALVNEITRHKAASRNTILSFIDELLTYRFIVCEAGDERRRPRHYHASEVTHQGMVGWMHSNLVALDVLDGGTRATYFVDHPELIRTMQPRIARDCLADHAWREPSERIALFLWNDAGGLIVDYLVSRIDLDSTHPQRYPIGHLDTRALAADFMISRTHLQRLFAKAVQHGCLGWEEAADKPELWMSRAFVNEYCHWQAIKFACIDEAFHWAKGQAEKAT